ncbi:inositol monophosphatase [Streptomyces avermitilis]|uniref:inositol-phosphate phosphatase n=2 Tax=Streptomyces avermitilis TaxID=33903 RepID=Q82LS3_STRAW|nr:MULTISPECIES: inositol monophosphatase family protein [Streptomyces]KUN55789.1 inositol monophosphatase [Streptomyces avermitilis]MYS97562.1 inositol monophosphatase [Streptomyces sp. SID5469]OOV25637.1 inositol monophosphatase [Streptomyces avermitilis]BAC69648.1 putative inositol monophosphatase [Streptomyces avermitilis MA-4680 = NBRC 14893]BBJ49677.1 inositol monophosphatase [Streptomyces avermitilis]
MIGDTETIEEFLAHRTSDVEEAVRQAAATEIMPRFRQLAAHEIDQKSGPHDLVTDADRKAEAYLTEVLAKLLPGSVVVGEEAVHANPVTYEAIQGEAPVWIVDPVDGTRQFVHGDPGFCTLVALAQGGVVHASWTYAPALDQLATAIRGRGAHLDGEPLRSGAPDPGRDLEVATSHPDYTTEEQKRALLALRTEGVLPRPCGSAGLEYLAVARGELDATAFSWEAAWDHAAGLLLVEEAGGAHLTRAGEPFRITGGNALPFTAARDEATARRVVGLLSAGG